MHEEAFAAARVDLSGERSDGSRSIARRMSTFGADASRSAGDVRARGAARGRVIEPRARTPVRRAEPRNAGETITPAESGAHRERSISSLVEELEAVAQPLDGRAQRWNASFECVAQLARRQLPATS